MGSIEVNKEFFINGNKVKIISGAVHYFRIVPEYWRDTLLDLKAMGCSVTPTEDGMIITGGTLHGASIHTLLDHRIAMAFSIAALVADGTTKILDSKCVDVSYPAFYDTFEQLL